MRPPLTSLLTLAALSAPAFAEEEIAPNEASEEVVTDTSHIVDEFSTAVAALKEGHIEPWSAYLAKYPLGDISQALCSYPFSDEDRYAGCSNSAWQFFMTLQERDLALKDVSREAYLAASKLLLQKTIDDSTEIDTHFTFHGESRSPLFVAIEADEGEIVNKLLSEGADPTSAYSSNSALKFAATIKPFPASAWKALTAYENAGPDRITSGYKEDVSMLLVQMASEGQAGILQYLLRITDVNNMQEAGHKAFAAADPVCRKILARHGYATVDGLTALAGKGIEYSQEVLELLNISRLDSLRTNEGQLLSVLFLQGAGMGNKEKVVDTLCEMLRNTDVNAQDRDGITAYAAACAMEDQETARWVKDSLISAGADPTISSFDGTVPQ